VSAPQVERRDDPVLPLEVGQLAVVIERATGRAPRQLTVRPFAYETSAPLFEVRARTTEGSMDLVLKDLGWWSLNDGARIAKPRELHDPTREPWAYHHLLAADPGPARRVAHAIGPQRSWLLLERVRGRELYQWGELEPWLAAVAWLAGFHSRWAVAARRRRVTDDGPLIVHDHTLLHCYGEPDDDWARAGRHLLAQPRTVVHGECYASDVLVDDDGRVTVLDWETAAIGSGWVDLAGLVAGWGEDVVELMLEQYLRCLDPALWPERPEATLDAARLQLCRQLCATSHLWRPPVEHRGDWAGEAARLLEKGHRW
jgi:hypothetical protein